MVGFREETGKNGAHLRRPPKAYQSQREKRLAPASQRPLTSARVTDLGRAPGRGVRVATVPRGNLRFLDDLRQPKEGHDDRRQDGAARAA